MEKKWEAAYYSAVRLDAEQECFWEELKEAFAERNIDILPLKGLNMKALYPERYLRQMSDFDILYREEDFGKIKEMLEELDWKFDSWTIEYNHQVFHNLPYGHVEMHRGLFDKHYCDVEKYYKDPWLRGIETEEKGIYRFSKEDEYVYLLAHAWKHFVVAGNGIRMLADFYLFRRTYMDSLDRAYIEAELKKIDPLTEKKEITLIAFEKLVCRQVEGLFVQDEILLDDGSFELLSDGVYGCREMAWKRSMREKGKFRYLMERIFPPYRLMKQRWKIVKYCPVLLPFVWVYRWFYGLFCRRNAVKEEMKFLKNSKKD